jgi:hypothetical protein
MLFIFCLTCCSIKFWFLNISSALPFPILLSYFIVKCDTLVKMFLFCLFSADLFHIVCGLLHFFALLHKKHSTDQSFLIKSLVCVLLGATNSEDVAAC